jgi:hypothetical protein
MILGKYIKRDQKEKRDFFGIQSLEHKRVSKKE